MNFIQGNKIRCPFFQVAHFVPFFTANLTTREMTDIDFIRFSALVFSTVLIGKTTDPVSEGTEMAVQLFNKLNEKEA